MGGMIYILATMLIILFNPILFLLRPLDFLYPAGNILVALNPLNSQFKAIIYTPFRHKQYISLYIKAFEKLIFLTIFIMIYRYL